jgi:peptidyl-dipeptidase A
MHTTYRLLVRSLVLAVLAAARPAAGESAPPPAVPPAPAAPADAKAFVAQVNAELKRLWSRSSTADWIRQTYITDDSERLAASLNEDAMAYLAEATRASTRFRSETLDPETARALALLRNPSVLPGGASVPAPSDPAKRAELALVAAKLDGIYGKGKWCGPAAPAAGAKSAKPAAPACRDLQQLEETLAKSRRWDVLLDAWAGWHTISAEMRPLYARLVALANEGSREVGAKDAGELWRSGYDMTPAEFEADVDRLWGEVKPFYEELHCFVRSRLQAAYGKERVPDGKPIPAHLLGNMWAQSWSNLYPMLEPYPNAGSLDVDGALRRQRWDPKRMVKLGEAFFTSLGLEPLPATFWERSQLTKPRDREVVCHASAWDVTFSNDLRIKMCIQPTEEDLRTIHHELGHNFYQRAYVHLPVLFQNGANDGFHEAIGDAIALSITPGYLKTVGLVAAVPKDERGVVNFQMKTALDKIPFLPFGRLMDQWRWDVFSGKVPERQWNAHWWELRRRYQGVDAPVARSEKDFDPGAKYHIPANVPYARYFLAHVYQFQFHEALCRAAGHEGPLHACSIYGSKAAGERLTAMMAMGASRPWPDALEALTGTRKADARPMLEYFAPLRAWLREQTKGRACGW